MDDISDAVDFLFDCGPAIEAALIVDGVERIVAVIPVQQARDTPAAFGLDVRPSPSAQREHMAARVRVGDLPEPPKGGSLRLEWPKGMVRTYPILPERSSLESSSLVWRVALGKPQ